MFSDVTFLGCMVLGLKCQECSQMGLLKKKLTNGPIKKLLNELSIKKLIW